MENGVLERIEEIKVFLEEKIEILLKNRLEKIEVLLKEEIENGNCKLQKELFRLAESREEGAIVCAFFRSSYLTKSHKFLLAFYKEEPFLEESPDCIWIDFHLFFQSADEDFQRINREIEKKFIRVLSAEKEEIRRWYMEQLYQEFGGVLFSLLGEEKEGIEVYYGGFMEELYWVGRVKK